MRPADAHDLSLLVRADWLDDEGRHAEADAAREDVASCHPSGWHYEYCVVGVVCVGVGVGVGVGCGGGGVGGVGGGGGVGGIVDGVGVVVGGGGGGVGGGCG